MEFAEIKERYKQAPAKKRWASAAGVGVLLVLFAYFSFFDFTSLEELQVSSESSAADSESRFNSARDQKANLPKMEEAVAVTEEQLAKARAKLPSNYDVEDTLHKVSTIAKELNVQLPSFVPMAEILSTGNNRYAELPIDVSLCGTYVQVAAFFDRVVHLEQSIKVRNVSMTSNGPCKTGALDPDSSRSLVGVEGSREQRRRIKVEALAQLVLFRASSELGTGIPPNGTGPRPAGEQPPAENAAPAGTPPQDKKSIESVRSETNFPRLGTAPVAAPAKLSGGNG